MVLKKLRFLIFMTLITIFLVLQSCEPKSQNKSERENRTYTIARSINLGEDYFQKGIYDSSYYYFNKAHLDCNAKEDNSNFIYTLSNMATIEQIQSDYTGSEATISKALPYLTSTTKINNKWNIYTTLGNNYLYTTDYITALYYFNKALNLKTKEILKVGIKNNIALTYMEQKDFYKAIQILSPLVLKKEVLNNSETYSRILDNLGYCYFKVGNPKAITYLNQSTIIRDKNRDDWGLVASYCNLAEYYHNTNLTLAYKYSYLAYQKATKLNSVDSRLQCLELLIQNSTGNQVKEYSLQYLHINDSIKKVRQQAKNQFAKIKYDFKKEKEENIELRAHKALQLERKSSRNQLLYFAIAYFTLLSLFITSFLTAKNKKEKLKITYNTEIRIAKKLHDELANDVFQTIIFAETHDLSTIPNKEILLNKLDTIYSRTRDISKENSIVETGIYFITNLKELISGFNTDTTRIIIHGLDAINWSNIEKTKKITVYRVVQELLINMKKHSKSSLVVLSFETIKKNTQISYTDNGIGITFGKKTLKNGLQNVENRINAIKGTVTFDTNSNKGLKVYITFPT